MRRMLTPDIVRLLARVGGRRMGDAGLPLALSKAAATVSTRGRRGASRGGLEAAGAVEWRAFNATRDRDDAGLLGARRRKSGAKDADAFHPLLTHKPGRTWLRMALATTADALAGTARGRITAQATAGRTARLLSYRWHDDDVACGTAIRLDLTRFSNARSLEDVCALEVDDACAVQGEGALSASVAVAWDAVLAEALPALAGATGRGPSALMLEVAAGATATLDLSIRDHVTVAFARRSRRGERAFRVQVRRQRGDERRLAAGFGVEAGFADPEAASHVLQGALAHVLGAPAEALAAIRHATSMRRVPARHRPLVGALVERFHIRDNAPLDALKARLAELDARLAGRVDEIVRRRVAVALDAEYRRLASDALLLEVELSEAALRRLHPALLALDTAAVLADPAVSRQAVSLLRDRSIERWQAWGIGASFGSWFDIGGRQERNDRVVTRRRIDADGDRTRREYLAATRYAARANGWATDYGATFEAVDDGAGGGTRCALELWWQASRMRADPAGLLRIVDDAVLWGVVDADGAAALHAHLQAVLDGIDRCRPRFERRLDADATASAIARMARARPADWARHAARALPRNAREPARSACAAREAAYGPALAACADLRGTALRAALAERLRDADPRLAARERKGETPWTCWQVLRQAGLSTRGPGAAWRGGGTAAARLDAMLARSRRPAPLDPAAWQVLADAALALRPAFEQPFTLRTMASLLAAGPAPRARLSLAYARDGEARTLIVGAAASD